MRDIEDYTKQYQTDSFEMEYKVPYRKKHVRRILEKYPHDNILEIGCGKKSILASVKGFKRATIIEPSEVFANEARKIGGVSVICALLEDCVETLKTEKFDFIILSNLLHEMESQSNFLRCVHSVGSNETVVHIDVPNANSFHRLLGVKCGVCNDPHDFTERNIMLQQHTVFDAKSLEELICETARKDGKEADICLRGSFFVKPFTNSQMAACLASGAISPEVIEGLDCMTQYMPDLGSEIYINYRLK